jgi:ActR/RegA family two-component response regulator
VQQVSVEDEDRARRRHDDPLARMDVRRPAERLRQRLARAMETRGYTVDTADNVPRGVYE